MATIDGSIAFGRQVVPFWWSRLSFSRRLGLRGFPVGLLEQDGLWLLTDAAHAGVFMVAFGRPEGRTWERAEVRYRAGPAGPVLDWWDLEQVRCAHCALDFDARGLPADVRGGLPHSWPAHLCLVHLVARYWTSDFGRFDAWRGRLVPAAPAPRAALDPAQYAPTPGLRATPGPAKNLAQRGFEECTNPVNPRQMELWMEYLQRRGVKFEIGTPVAELKLFDNDSVGIYSQHTRTIYLLHPPNVAAFFEEAFHALQHLHGHPESKTLDDGTEVDAWEYDAKKAVLTHAEKLGLSYEEYIKTEKQLQQVIDGTYNNKW